MAKQDPLSMVYGGQIGQGEAQVFDTTRIIQYMHQQKEHQEKKLLDSIIDLDTSNVANRDMAMYNDKWSKYRDFVKDNHRKLQNPSKNMDIWAEKKRIEQELLQFVKGSHEAAKQAKEISKFAYTNSDEWEPRMETTFNQELYDSYIKEGNSEIEARKKATTETGRTLLDAFNDPKNAGKFNISMQGMIKKTPIDITKWLTDSTTKANQNATSKVTTSVTEGGVTTLTSQETLYEDSYNSSILADYETSPKMKKAIQDLWTQHTNEGKTTAETPEEFLLELAATKQQKTDFKQTKKKVSGFSINFVSGGGGNIGEYNMGSSEEINIGGEAVNEVGIRYSKQGGNKIYTGQFTAGSVQVPEEAGVEYDYQDTIENLKPTGFVEKDGSYFVMMTHPIKNTAKIKAIKERKPSQFDYVKDDKKDEAAYQAAVKAWEEELKTEEAKSDKNRKILVDLSKNKSFLQEYFGGEVTLDDVKKFFGGTQSSEKKIIKW